MTDAQLLTEYIQHASQEAFGALVGRYIDIVYAATRRQVADPGMAEDVTQAVFLLLSRRAGSLRNPAALGAWLLQTTRYAACDALKARMRRQHHEQQAATMKPESTPSLDASDTLWQTYAPAVDQALARLPEIDRVAIVLRYLRDLPLREVGESLNLSEEAARKRVDRGIARLRGLLATQAPSLSASSLAMALATHGTAPAPATLAQAILATSPATSSAAAAIAARTAHTLAWAKAKVAALIVAGATAATTVVVLATHTASAPPAASQPSFATTLPTTLPGLPADLRAAEEKIDVPALVREARAKEAWIDEVQSFRATCVLTSTRSAAQIKQRTAELLKQDPKADLSPARNPELRPNSTTRIDIAFDRKRYSIERTDLDRGTGTRDSWDGQRFRRESTTAIDAQPTSMIDGAPVNFRMVLLTFSCFRTANHPGRYAPGEEVGEDFFARPEDFQLAGRTNYHGVDCYLLVCPASYRRWYIGISDHRIYGVTIETNTPATLDEHQRIMNQTIAEKAGRAMTDRELAAWFDSLSAEQQNEMNREIIRRTYHLAVPIVENWVRDYKEIAPGIFFPMTQGVTIYDPPGTGIGHPRQGVITDIEINQPLPEDLW